MDYAHGVYSPLLVHPQCQFLRCFVVLSAEFLLYIALVAAISLYLILRVSPEIGHQNILVDLIICSLVGSIRCPYPKVNN